MSRYVVDASIAVKWFFREPYSDAARRLLQPENELFAPDLLAAEFGNVLWKRVRSREMTAEQAGTVLDALLGIPLQGGASEALARAALEIAVSTGRSVYDSIYLALALRENAPLVTADKRLFNGLQGTPVAGALIWVEDLLNQ